MFQSFSGLSASYFRLEEKVHFRTSCMRMETMTFARQAGAAVFLITLTLSMQCAGIAVLISWARASVERGIARLSSLHAAVLMNPIFDSGDCSAFSADPRLVNVLPLVLSSVVGVLVLLFRHQLFHGRLW